MSTQSTDTSTEVDTWEFLKKILILGAPFSVGLGCLYLTGFWSVFEINIFQYANISDIAASTMVPLLVVFILNIIGSTLGYEHGNRSSNNFNPHGDTIIKKMLNIFKQISFALMVVLCVVLVLMDWKKKWLVIPILVTIPVIKYIQWKNLSLFPGLSRERQLVFIMMISLIVLESYGLGNIHANALKYGERYQRVVASNATELTPDGRSPKDAIRFVGHIGDFDFFYDPVFLYVKIMKVQDENMLTLHYFKDDDPFLKFLYAIPEWIKKNFP